MGLSIASDKFLPDDYVRFSHRLNECLRVLSAMLQDPAFGGAESSWGAELELYLVDGAGEVVHCNEEVLAEAANPQLTPELNRFNLEYNSAPVIASPTPLSQLQAEFESALSALAKITRHYSANPVAIGILPTVKQSDFGLSHMTDLPRYRALTNGLKKIGSGEFRIHINGEPPLKMVVDDVTFEGANTSFQVHYRVAPAHFAKLYNGLILATPIVLGIAGNSPTLFGHRLWRETRIPLFKHSIDSRPKSSDWRQPARVSLGQGFLRNSAYELFAESVATQPPVLPICSDRDYMAEWKSGEVPRLDELRMHQNTVWSWLRPVYDYAAGGHLRIELRVLPAGPTLVDMMANAAFYIGLGEAIADRADDMLPGMPFNYAKYNFYRAAQFGTSARLVWPIQSRHCLEERDLCSIARSLLPMAREGLQRTGMHERDINHYLSIIEERIATRQTGADWQLQQLQTLGCNWPAPQEALRDVLAGYMQRQTSGVPVARWSEL